MVIALDNNMEDDKHITDHSNVQHSKFLLTIIFLLTVNKNYIRFLDEQINNVQDRRSSINGGMMISQVLTDHNYILPSIYI